MNQGRTRSIAFALLGVGALVVLISSQQPWWHLRQSLGGTTITKSVSGTARAASTAIGLLMLASVPAVHAVRARFRALLGLILVLLAFVTFLLIAKRKVNADAVAAVLNPHVTGTVWPHVAAGAMVVCLLGALVVTGFGKRWPEMGRKYDAGPRPVAPQDPWAAMEQGIDPTEDHQPG